MPGDLLWAVYIRGKPHEVGTTDGAYDFEHTKRHGTIFKRNSGGPANVLHLPEFVNPRGCSFWAASSVEEQITTGAGCRIATPDDVRRLGLRRHREQPHDPFADARECDGIEYCSICNEHMPDDDTCGHIYDSTCGVSGPGADEYGEGAKASFMTMCRTAGIVRAVHRGLSPFSLANSQCHALGGLGPSFVHLSVRGREVCDLARRLEGRDHLPPDDDLRDGVSWLFALDKKTTKANEMTRRWLEEEIARQDARRTSDERCYLIRESHWYGGYETDEAHADFRGDGKRLERGFAPRQSCGAWWTNYDGRRFALRHTWLEAKARLRAIRAAGGHEAAIVYVKPRVARAR